MRPVDNGPTYSLAWASDTHLISEVGVSSVAEKHCTSKACQNGSPLLFGVVSATGSRLNSDRCAEYASVPMFVSGCMVRKSHIALSLLYLSFSLHDLKFNSTIIVFEKLYFSMSSLFE